MSDSGKPGSQREGKGPRMRFRDKAAKVFSRSKGPTSADLVAPNQAVTEPEQPAKVADSVSQNPVGKAGSVQSGAGNSDPQEGTSSTMLIATKPGPAQGPSSKEISVTTSEKVAPINRLWEEAYDEIKAADNSLIQRYEKALCGSLFTGVAAASGISIQKRMEELLRAKVAQAKEETWKIHFYGKEIPVKDLAGPVVNVIKLADEYISGAVSANPYASIAWSGVSLLLPLVLNPSAQSQELAKALQYISDLIVCSIMRENLYTRWCRKEKGGSHVEEHHGYRDTLKSLYVEILKFQAESICYFSKNAVLKLASDMVKWTDWSSFLSDIQTRETAFVEVYSIWKDKIYQDESEAHEEQRKEIMITAKMMAYDLQAMKTAVSTAYEDKKRMKLLEWLSSATIDPSKNFNNAKDKRNTDTGVWLLNDNQSFKCWKPAPKSLLWLNGKAGSGKSVLSSSVIQHIRDSYNDDPSIALGYFYFSFAETSKQSPSEMLCSIIKQLCCQRPDTPPSLESLRKYQEMGQRPDRKTLEDTLLATTRDFSHVYLILDALDECPTANNERATLLKAIRRIYKEAPDSLHLFVTSRRELDIKDAFIPIIESLTTLAAPSHFDVNLSDLQDDLSQDIGLYISQTLDEDFHWSPALKEEAKTALLEKADGMFQYVSCQFDELRCHEDEKSVRIALQALPNGLDDTYDRMLQNVEPKYKKNVASVLKWLAFSMRPLSVEELAEAFVIDYDHEIPFDEESRIIPPERVLRYLAGFVTEVIVKGYPKDSTEIRFAHFSIEEYLCSTRIKQTYFSTPERASHFHISECCFAYHIQLSKFLLATEEALEQYYLWKYASGFGIAHIERAGGEFWSLTIPPRALILCETQSQSLLNYVRIRSLNRRWHWDVTSDQLASPLHYAAASGSSFIIQHLLETGANVNCVSEFGAHGSPLIAAAANGRETVVQILLDNHADVQVRQEKFGNTALHQAVYKNYINITKILINAGADVNSQDGYFGTVLQAASYSSNIECVQLLLDKGAEVNAQGGKFGTALQAAASEGRIDSVKLLLDKGAEVNAQGGKFGTALQAAASDGATECVKLLLDKGAEVNAQGGKFGTALHAAASAGATECVKLLLDKGAEVNAQGGEFGTALQAGAFMGTTECVQLLLDKGAEVNPQGGRYGNALRAAIARDRLKTAELLISRGAELGIFSQEAENPLAENTSKEFGGGEQLERIREFQKNPSGYIEQRRHERYASSLEISSDEEKGESGESEDEQRPSPPASDA